MGYFANGIEGGDYEEEYCCKCIHYSDNPEVPQCPVLLLHELYNYDDCNKKDSFLHVLIPRNERGYNEKCTMFIPEGLISLITDFVNDINS